MSWSSLFADDEKLGKKDDDHWSKSATQPASWAARKTGQTVRRRRILYLLCGILFVFLFVKNIPTDIGPHPRWADSRIYHGPRGAQTSSAPSPNAPAPVEPSTKPPRPKTPPEAFDHYHDGPIKFWRLAASLHAVAKLGGQRDHNQNVLFAAASLKSVSELLPLACEMARWDRNDVHLALMGRDDLDIEQVQSINGLAEGDCNVHWHDARPDFSIWSTDFRMESSVAASLEHIQTFIHPQVVLIDDPKREDSYLTKAIREKALDLSKPLIELPSNAMESLLWITRLDSSSLAAWSKVHIDIVVQAHSGSSGSLVRLLKSLEAADYFSVRRPHLTIELPHDTDESTIQYLDGFAWPPVDWSGVPQTSQLTLRHRIDRKTMSPEEASARLVESFWPQRNADSHLLLLSPQIELSPLYFHYMFYSVLEYRYSLLGRSNEKYQNVAGISLHLPEYHLNDKGKFIPPTSKDRRSNKDKFPGSRLPFLWQAPNNNAALYFGDKWMEFHSFLGLRLARAPSTLPKEISKKHPAWMEFLLEFMKARGYSLLYPGAFFNDLTITTVHDELYQIPEEFSRQSRNPNANVVPPSSETPLDGNVTRARQPPPNIEKPLLETSLLDLLPNKADLLELNTVPSITFDGRPQDSGELMDSSSAFAGNFRKTIGGCVAGRQPPHYTRNQANDLFCDQKEPYNYQQAGGRPHLDVRPVEQMPPVDVEAAIDSDRITAKEAENAKAEKALHLDRQAGLSAAEAKRSKQELISEHDRGEEVEPVGTLKAEGSSLVKNVQEGKGSPLTKMSKGSEETTRKGNSSIENAEEEPSETTDDGEDQGSRNPGW